LDLRPLRSTRIYRIGKAAKPLIGTTRKTLDRYTIIKSDSEVYNNFCKKGDRSTGYNLLILVVGLFDHYTIIIA